MSQWHNPIEERLWPLFSLLLDQQHRTHQELEHNWRQQLLVAVAGISVVSELDTGVAELLGFQASGQESFELVVRFAVAFYGFFLFFRFGPIMAHFRDQRLALETLLQEVFPDPEAAELRRKYGRQSIKTTSHFEYLLAHESGRGAELLVIVATCAVFACNHVLGATLGVEALYGLSNSRWLAGTLGICLLLFTMVLYVGFILTFRTTYRVTSDTDPQRRDRIKSIDRLTMGMALCSLAMSTLLLVALHGLDPTRWIEGVP